MRKVYVHRVQVQFGASDPENPKARARDSDPRKRQGPVPVTSTFIQTGDTR